MPVAAWIARDASVLRCRAVILYRIVQRILRACLGIFFRRVEVVGDHHVPAEGTAAVIFAGNHSNSLIDPAVIIGFSGRIVHFAAKDVLFKSGLLRPVLLALGAIPIARKKDHAGGQLDNEGAFERLFDVLATGRAVGIFPEGISHDFSEVQPIKTGAARIAFGVAQRYPDTPVLVVPTGLNYGRPKRFRSSVLLQFGEPVAIDAERMAAYAADPRQAVRGLTDAIQGHIRALTVNAEDWQTIRLMDAVRRIYQPAGLSFEARIELSRRLNSAYRDLADEPEIQDLYAGVGAYQARLDAIGLRDRDLLRHFGPMDIFARFYVNVLRVLLWIPLALPGSLVHVPLALVAQAAGVTLSPRKDVIGTSKLVAGLLIVVATYAALIGLAAFTGGMYAAVVVGCLLPLSGLATIRVLERYASARGLLIATARFMRFRQEVADLRRERARLEAAVIHAVERFIPADLEPMFLAAGKARIGEDAGAPVTSRDADVD